MPPKRKISINYDFGPGKYRFGKKRGKHISDEQWQMTGLGKKKLRRRRENIPERWGI